MTRRPWVILAAMLLGASGGWCADAGEDAHAMIEGMHAALLEGKPDALRAFFDPKIPGFKKLSADIGALLKEALAPSSVEFVSNTGDERARDLEMDWRLEIRAYNQESSVERRARVKLRAEKQDGRWRIVSFAPMDFFAPVRDAAVREAIADMLGALTAVTADAQHDHNRVPGRFLDAFDSKMPGYDRLRTNVVALLDEGDIESFAEVVSIGGDDRRRTVELDWVLSLIQPRTAIAIFRRHEVVKCQMELQGAKWRIVALDPMEFLAPEKK
jgi:hypothetical protein